MLCTQQCVQKLCDVKPASTPQLIYNSGRSFTDSQMCCSVKELCFLLMETLRSISLG